MKYPEKDKALGSPSRGRRGGPWWVRLCCGLACLMTVPGGWAGQAEWQSQYERAEWVARLRIEGVARLVNPALSRDQLIALQGHRYNASVVENWKGEVSGAIRFQVDLGDCADLLDIDEDYIVFGVRNYRGDLQASSCADIVSFEQAGPLPDLLDNWKSSRRLAGHGSTQGGA